MITAPGGAARNEFLLDAVKVVRRNTSLVPNVALVLGSGLGDIAERFSDAVAVDTASISGYPRGSVEGHRGRLIFASHGGVPLLAYQGRVHFYECNEIDSVLFPIRLGYELGARTLIITNAAGGVNRQFVPGDLMLITDQVNLTTERVPVQNYSNRRTNSLYDRELIQVISDLAEQLSIPLWRGVYAGVKGPSYETAAEVEMVHRIGGDAVGMSTVLETSLASILGMRVAGISCITNQATGIGGSKLSHNEVTQAAAHAKADFSRLILALIQRL